MAARLPEDNDVLVVTSVAMPDNISAVRDSAAFETLYRTLGPRVKRYVVRRAGLDAADDVVAEVFVVAWRKRDHIPDDALPWLLAVARRVLANTRRGEARRDALFCRMLEERSADRRQSAELDWPVLQALSRLREADREILILTAWDG